VSFPYEIVAYRPEFKQQVAELTTESWSTSIAANLAYFEWKHERNPYVPGPLLYLALHEGKVVGMRSFFGIRWEAGSPPTTLTALYADDMVVARDHRDRGLIPRIMATAFENLARLGHEYVFNLSAAPVTLLSSLSTGWRHVGAMQPMRWRSWRAAGEAAMRRVAGPLHGHRRRTSPATGPPWSLVNIDPDHVARRFSGGPSVSFALAPRMDAMSALVEQLGSDGRIRHVRDRGYFEWRLQNPLRRYGFLSCVGAEGEGYLILKEPAAEASDPRALSIVDWEASSPPILDRLLQAACFVAGHHTPLFIWSATLDPTRTTLLEKNGFRVNKREGMDRYRPPLLVRSLVEGRPEAKWLLGDRRFVDLADWDLRMLYSMLG
jgi:GNAT superfamily N-acetyltransferase